MRYPNSYIQKASDKLYDGSNEASHYYGEALIDSLTSDPVWKIRKISFSGVNYSNLQVSWADGDMEYDNIWDNRTNLTYRNLL